MVVVILIITFSRVFISFLSGTSQYLEVVSFIELVQIVVIHALADRCCGNI
jgi:hypothetical protein